MKKIILLCLISLYISGCVTPRKDVFTRGSGGWVEEVPSEFVIPDTTEFDNNLSSADRNLQIALETIDEMAAAGAFDATAEDTLTWGDGTLASFIWTYSVTGTNPTLTFGDAAIDLVGGFTTTGNVGIGTTTPGYKLDVQGGAIQQQGSAGIGGYLLTNSGDLRSETNLNPGILVFHGTAGNDYGMDLGYNGGYRTRIFTANTTDIAFGKLSSPATAQSHFTEWMTIDAAGNVGIGTTTPAEALHIKDGDVLVEDDTPHIERRPTVGNAFEDYAYANEWYFVNKTTGAILWKANPADLFLLYGLYAFPNSSPTDDYILKYDAALGRLNWETDAGAAGGDSWGDAVDADILPTGNDNTFDLGSVAASFKDGYFQGTLEAGILTEGGNAVSNDTEIEAVIEPLIDTLANLTSVQTYTVTLTDPNADAFFGWDDAGGVAYEILTAAEAMTIIGGAANDFDGSGDVTNDSHTHGAGNITGTDAGTDLTADLEEEVTAGSLADNTIGVAELIHEDFGEITYASGSAVIEDSISVSSWNLTTPTITTSLTTSTPTTLTVAELDRLDGLAGVIVTDVTACTDIEGTLLSIGGTTLNAAIPEDHITATMLIDDNAPADEDIYSYESTGPTGHWYSRAEVGIGTATVITDDLIINADLNIDAEATDEDFLQYDSTGDNFTWRSDSEVMSDLSSAANDWDASGDVTIAAADISDQNVGTDITADLEEEVTAGSLADDTINDADINWGDIANMQAGGGVTLAATATALATARDIGGSAFDGSANIDILNVTVADTVDTTCWPALFESATGTALTPMTDGALTYNAGTGTLAATEFVGGGSGLTLASTDLSDTANVMYVDQQDVGTDYTADLEEEVTAGSLADDTINDDDINWADIAGLVAGGYVPSGAAVADPNAAGELAVDTSTDQFLWYGGAQRVMPYFREKGFVLEDPAAADDDVPFWHPHDNITITDCYCETQGGTSAEVIISDGTNALETITCDADGQADDGSIANGTFTANERMEFDIGTVTGSVDWVAFTITYTIDAD